MQVRDEHFYIGAAIMQIVENPGFTSIAGVRDTDGSTFNNAFTVNKKTIIFCKYATDPRPPYQEFRFTFSHVNIASVRAANRKFKKIFLVLVCVEARQICCLPVADFEALIASRVASAQKQEDKYNILVTAPRGRSLRAYVNAAETKKTFAGEMKLIPRQSFPSMLF